MRCRRILFFYARHFSTILKNIECAAMFIYEKFSSQFFVLLIIILVGIINIQISTFGMPILSTKNVLPVER